MGGSGLIVVVVGGGFVASLLVEILKYRRAVHDQPNRDRAHQRLMREISRHGK